MKNLAIFDFDGTVYKKDSLIEFCKFVYRKKPLRVRFIFFQFAVWGLFLLGLIDSTRFKEQFLIFIKNISKNHLHKMLDEFWSEQFPVNFNKRLLDKIKELQNRKIKAICISASPEFFLKSICKNLGVYLIGTQLYESNNKYLIKGVNCRGPEKIARLKKKFKKDNFKIVYAVSDNKDDMELLKLAEQFEFLSK